MNKWVKKRIGDLGRIITGQTPSTKEIELWNGDIPFVSPKDMNWDSFYLETTRDTASNRMAEMYKGLVVPKNSVMYTALSYGFGKMAISTRICIANRQIHSISVSHEHYYRFVFYLLRYSTPYIFAFNSGIDTPIVPKSVFAKIELEVPPFLTQRKISAILSAYDELIENNNRRIAILEKMAEELYREWFVRMRFPSHQDTKFVKGMPEEWGETQFGEIARFTMGQSPKSEFYNDVGEGLPFHQGVGTYGNRFPNTVTYCSVDGRRAFKGDILFSVRAPVGRLNIADCDMIIGRGLAAIRHVDGKNVYLYYLMKTVFASEDIIGNGAIFNSVGKDELSRFGVHRHPEALIEKFEGVAGPVDQQIENLIRATSTLTKTRDLLLPRLISGKLSVEDIDIQFPPSMQEEATEPESADA